MLVGICPRCGAPLLLAEVRQAGENVRGLAPALVWEHERGDGRKGMCRLYTGPILANTCAKPSPRATVAAANDVP